MAFREDGLGLRFDLRFNFCPGEDTQLFTTIERAGGGLLVASDLPIVHEEVVAARLTFRRQVARKYSCGQGNTHIDRKHAIVIPVHLMLSLRALIEGILLGGLTLSRRRFKKKFLKAAKSFAYAAGQVSALMGRRFEPYRVIDGH